MMDSKQSLFGGKAVTITSIHFSIGILFLSFSMGFFKFYLISDFTKENPHGTSIRSTDKFRYFYLDRKNSFKCYDLLEDPLAILAYPSNSHAFYLASLFSVITILIHSKRGNIEVLPFLNGSIHMF